MFTYTITYAAVGKALINIMNDVTHHTTTTHKAYFWVNGGLYSGPLAPDAGKPGSRPRTLLKSTHPDPAPPRAVKHLITQLGREAATYIPHHRRQTYFAGVCSPRALRQAPAWVT